MDRPMLRFGSTGPAVELLQRALNAAHSLLARLEPDGQFGPKTQGRVVEFQRDSNLDPDGIVGPRTHAFLEQWYEFLEAAVAALPAQAELVARVAISSIAQHYLMTYGWLEGGDPPVSGNADRFRVAARWYYGNPVKDSKGRTGKLRYGGTALENIFSTVGASAAACKVLSEAAYAMYRRKFSAKERNNTDIASWCGMFALFVYKSAGLKTGAWQTGSSINSVTLNKAPCFRQISLGELAVGDVGIIEPQKDGRNHHVLVIGVDPPGDPKRTEATIETVEGNANTRQFQTIVRGSYKIRDPKQEFRKYAIKSSHGDEDAKSGEHVLLYSPNWSVVLKPSG